MGLIYNKNAKEKELYSAYGMTVYGTEMDYDWTIYPDKPTEKCYTTLRIANILNGKQNEILNMQLGNRCIFKENFERTVDNFLYWIENDMPFDDAIENTVFKVLTCADSLFNYRIEQRKRKEREQEEQRKRAEEREKFENDAIVEIAEYCIKHGYFSYEKYREIVILKPMHEKIREMIKSAIDQCNTERMELYVNFAMKHTENNDLRIVSSGAIEEVLEFIRKDG